MGTKRRRPDTEDKVGSGNDLPVINNSWSWDVEGVRSSRVPCLGIFNYDSACTTSGNESQSWCSGSISALIAGQKHTFEWEVPSQEGQDDLRGRIATGVSLAD